MGAPRGREGRGGEGGAQLFSLPCALVGGARPPLSGPRERCPPVPVVRPLPHGHEEVGGH